MADLDPQILKTLVHDRQLCTARFSPCGKFLVATGYDAMIHRWDVTGEEPRPLPPLTGHHGWVQSLTFSDDWLVTADSWGRLTMRRYADEMPQPKFDIEDALDGWIRALATSPDGSLVAIGGNDSRVRLFSIATGEFIADLNDHPDDVFSIAFHPDGQSLVTGDLKGVIRHWDVGNKKVIRELQAPDLFRLNRIQDCGGVRRLAFDADGKQLLAAGQFEPGGGFAEGVPAVLVFDWLTGHVVHDLKHGEKTDGFVYDTAFHPDGYVMAISCAMPGKGQLWFWRLGDEEPFYIGKGIVNGRSLCLAPDKRTLAVVRSLSKNRNGRPTDGDYVGGTAEILLLDMKNA